MRLSRLWTRGVFRLEGKGLVFVTLLTIFHICVCVLLIAIVLLQQGRGADMGATFGGGSNTIFGASGADTLLTKVTTGCAAFFMISSLLLALSAKRHIVAEEGGNLFKGGQAPKAQEAPLTPQSEPGAPADKPSTEATDAAPAPAAALPAEPASAAAEAKPEAPSPAEPASAAQAGAANAGSEPAAPADAQPAPAE